MDETELEIGYTLARFTIPQIIAQPPRLDKRRRDRLLAFVRSLPPEAHARLREAIRDDRAPKRHRLLNGNAMPLPARSEFLPGPSAVHTGDIEDLIDGPFLQVAPVTTVNDCIARFIDRTSNAALRKVVCVVCARRIFQHTAVECEPEQLPNKDVLRPTHPHPQHELVGDILLHAPAVRQPAPHYVCSECHAQLLLGDLPRFALANNLWIGDIPFELSVLDLAERLLIGLHFPAVYVIKLFPKAPYGKHLKESTIASGVRGNVSTYRLGTNEIAEMVSDQQLPRPAALLSALIAVTFVGFKKLPLRILSKEFEVRRHRVRDALLWLKANNPLYADVDICEECLNALPEAGVPAEIELNVRYTADESVVLREHAGYVPPEVNDDEESEIDESEERQPAAEAQDESQFDHLGPASPKQPNDDPVDYDPAVFALQPHGTIDVAADSVSDTQLFSAAVDNMLPPPIRRYKVRPGSQFVSEYPRTINNDDIDRPEQRTTGGPGNANHLLGCFPVLFPYGAGGVEVDRVSAIPYEQHIRWALQYDDGRFRKDFYFMFQAFGVLQKRLLARSSSLQVRRSTYIQNQLAFQRLTVGDFHLASQEEEARRPISNPVIRSLHHHMTAVRARVLGTDENRIGIRSQVWGMTLRFNPPTLWTTLNLADTSDPIAQVLAGQDIDLDRFCQSAGTDSEGRSTIIAGDPFASAEFFHVCIRLVLEELLGITATHRGNVEHHMGIFGVVNGYIGTVEAQARGTLHLHMLIWLRGAPVARVMKEALSSEIFREKMKSFIRANIRAHLPGTTAKTLLKVPMAANIAYSRPEDPRLPHYTERAVEMERKVARVQQVHECWPHTCERIKNGVKTCKRRAPWPTADDDWVMATGEWGPKRAYGFLNAWNPPLLQTLRCNQDIKVISNGAETKDITFYITLYIAKRQIQAANASALMAKGLAYKARSSRRIKTMQDLNKRMLQRCVNILNRQHEFSGPEAVSYLMGWGDRFISHTYVKIYWDQIMSHVRHVFPHVRGAQFATGLLSTMVADVIDQEEDLPATLTRNDDGVFVLRDQLKEYTDRGERLTNMNFYDYYTLTYDGQEAPTREPTGNQAAEHVSPEDIDDDDHVATGHKRRRGRPISERVPYMPGSRRRRCRIIRGRKQEVNLHFIGKWFPRADVPAEHEYYCLQMLLLFKPWRDLRDLGAGVRSFAEAFTIFQQTANPDHLRIIENMQYFYECSDRANARREAAGNADTAGPGPGAGDFAAPDGMLHMSAFPVELTKEDVQLARESRYAMRERIYGEGALSVALDEGIFASTYTSVPPKPIARQATLADMAQFHEWGQRIASYTRSAAFAENNGVDVGGVEDASNQTILEAVTGNQLAPDDSATVIDMTPSTANVATHRDVQLNVEQQRAHDLVLRHLRRTLAGERPPQLLMVIQGEGGTRKTVVLNSIANSFAELEASHLLAKTATTGVAASLFGGQTLHNWAGLRIGDVPRRGSEATQAKRMRNMRNVLYLIIDEFSMMTKRLLASTSDVINAVKHDLHLCEENDAFGGISVILVGDLH
uniref:ATP-dependent DNA helicase n=1 Tax=Mycena chlorophos TaxID=658473 RepID=A0ABQ0L250_MYCCL|nr:predicted protein [Mycena chlorophos]